MERALRSSCPESMAKPLDSAERELLARVGEIVSSIFGPIELAYFLEDLLIYGLSRIGRRPCTLQIERTWAQENQENLKSALDQLRPKIDLLRSKGENYITVGKDGVVADRRKLP